MLPGKKYSPEMILRILIRRKWLIVAPFIAGVAVSVAIAKRVPERYKSETLIMVVPQRVPSELVRPTDATRIEDRLASISDQIQTRSRLERVITEFNLYAKDRERGVLEDVVQRMRTNDINVKLEGKDQSAFRVSYVSDNPHTAQKVTERLASWYIEENLRDKARFSESTNEFLESELEDAKRRLMDHEKKLEEYRRRYSGQLPSQLETNLQAIQNAQLQLQSVSDTINRATERRLLFERQLADAEGSPASVVPEVAGGAPPDVSQLSAAQQLELARAALERARLRYTADHPDVRALERTIRELEPKAAEERRLAGERPTTAAVSPAEAARQKRIREYRAELDIIDRQIAGGRAEQARLQKLMADYQGKVDAVPSRESELVELTRDYTTLQASYTSLLGKREESKLAANLERRNIGEQFRVLDPPSLPQRPVNQKVRLMVVGGGSMVGLVLGLLIVGFLEYRDSTFKTEEDVVDVLSLPVLALVPVMTPTVLGAPSRQRKSIAALLITLGSLLSVLAIAVWSWQW